MNMTFEEWLDGSDTRPVGRAAIASKKAWNHQQNYYQDAIRDIIERKNDVIDYYKNRTNKAIDMLVNDNGECLDCVLAKLEGYTICGDCDAME